MGDRGMIVVHDGYDSNQVGLYTHWFGSDLPRILQEALNKGKEQWDDPPYLARIIFCEMIIADNSNDGTKGFGIHSIDLSEFPSELIGHREPIIVYTVDKEIKIGETILTFGEFLSYDLCDLDKIYN